MKTKKLILMACLLLGAASQASALEVFGLAGTSLVNFDSATPGTLKGTVAITGLAPGASLVGIDFRPADNMLYGVGSNSRIYSINTATGAATLVPTNNSFTLDPMGTSFDIDFNPVADRLRITSDTDQNLRIQLNGTSSTDSTLKYLTPNPPNPNVVGSAYTNSFAGATSTQLFDIDSANDSLVIQNANPGELTIVGGLGLGFNVGPVVGFDIFFFGNQAFASLGIENGPSSFYKINLQTGAATLVGGFANGLAISDIAIRQVPEPESMLLMMAGLLALAGTGIARRKA